MLMRSLAFRLLVHPATDQPAPTLDHLERPRQPAHQIALGSASSSEAVTRLSLVGVTGFEPATARSQRRPESQPPTLGADALRERVMQIRDRREAMKSARRNNAEGTLDRIAGRLLEMFGKVTGRKSTGAKGKAARAAGPDDGMPGGPRRQLANHPPSFRGCAGSIPTTARSSRGSIQRPPALLQRSEPARTGLSFVWDGSCARSPRRRQSGRCRPPCRRGACWAARAQGRAA